MRKYTIAVLALVAAALPVSAQEVFKSITLEQAEKLLRSRRIEYKKTDTSKKDTYVFDFKKNGVPMAFYVFGGTDVMLDGIFPSLTLEGVNQWNQSAKFSRASVRKEGSSLISVLEFNLDLQGGVSWAALERFFDTFEDEAKGFGGHVGATFKEEPILTAVSDEMLEKTLSSLGHKATKTSVKDVTTFALNVRGMPVKLISMEGKELFADAIFPSIPVEKANNYNLNRKFVRVVVLRTEKGDAFTTLQASFDATGGVTAGILRHFLTSFEQEVASFAVFNSKSKK